MMTADEAITARKTLGLSQDALAAELGLTPHVVAAWEEGTVRIPKQIEELLRYKAAVVVRDTALATGGPPECEIYKALKNEIMPEDLQSQSEQLERRSAHEIACPVCKARGKFIVEQIQRVPPVPMTTSVRTIVAVSDRIANFPRWAQPAAVLALYFGAYSLLKILFTLPQLARHPEFWKIPLEGLALSMSIGGAIGLIYGGFRQLREKGRHERR
jgi:transcriptional regulator with XRE-family HTH domain